MSTPAPVVRGWRRVPLAILRWLSLAVRLTLILILTAMPVPVVLFFSNVGRARRNVPAKVLKKHDE